MRFTELGLSPELLKGVEGAGYEQPTPIQSNAIPVALTGRDIIGCAQTGTGKTAAFVLPILQRLGSHGALRALVLVPTRELAAQVDESFRTLSTHTGIECVSVYGGVPLQPQKDAFDRGVDVIIATPGRLLDHMERRNVDLKYVEFLVLDEADRMLDMGFAPDIYRILRKIPTNRQSMLFSATIPPEIDRLASRTLKDPVTVEVGERQTTAVGVNESLYWVLTSEKPKLLLCLLDRLSRGPTLVFCRTRRGADEIDDVLQGAGYKVTALHSDRTQAQREGALAGFRDGRYDILVATDIAARGIDVTGITHVINYDVPEYAEDYVHRVGRTARAEALGDAITFVDPWDEQFVNAIQKFIGHDIPTKPLPEGYMSYELPPRQPRRRPPQGGGQGYGGGGGRGGSGGNRGGGPRVGQGGQGQRQARERRR